MGRRAMLMALTLMSGSTAGIEDVVLSGQLVVRETTDVPSTFHDTSL